MSFAGIVEFKENLDKLTSSEQFKNADLGEQLRMGSSLVRCNNIKLNKKIKNFNRFQRLCSSRVA